MFGDSDDVGVVSSGISTLNPLNPGVLSMNASVWGLDGYRRMVKNNTGPFRLIKIPISQSGFFIGVVSLLASERTNDCNNTFSTSLLARSITLAYQMARIFS